MAKKLKSKPVENPKENVKIINKICSPEVRDNWNQITLSLASNGGYTINHGRDLTLYVIIKETIDGKAESIVKSFVVTKQELFDLESESKEFSDEIEKMLIARDKEESSNAGTVKDISKDTKKKDEPKKAVGKSLTDVLKKGLDSSKKKDVVVDYGQSEDFDTDPVVEDPETRD